MNEPVRRTTIGAAPRGHEVRVTLGVAVVAACAACMPVSVDALARPAEQLQSVHVVEVAHRLVTVQVRDAPLSEVLDEIARQTGLTIEGHAAIDSRMTIDLEQIRLEAALRLILEGQSYAVEFALEAIPDKGEHIRVPQRLRISPDDPDVAARSWSPDDVADAGLDGNTIDPTKIRAVLESSDDPWDREDAVEALAESGQPHVAVPLITVALIDRNEDVRLAAVEALATLGGDAAAKALQTALRDEESTIREAAIETLEALGGEQAARSLAVALQDTDADLRERAVDALGNIASPSAVQLLEYAWAADEDASVREAAAAWLTELSTGVRH